jgi:pSer/pThr/pTyr-binding forkhead associated (FHA) protein
MSGPSKGQIYDLRDEVCTIGRSPDNNIQIMDKTVSRRHLKIFKKKNEYYIQDLKSRNGTFVNGSRVQAGEEL